ncbi:hypothetical protein [Streptomyces sp. NPDC048644]|uniref:hypothetical protein n=1 Tax=Streptomyces sp. NPDC048644 TaxID=3365582 RepID=UPI0037182B0C
MNGKTFGTPGAQEPSGRESRTGSGTGSGAGSWPVGRVPGRGADAAPGEDSGGEAAAGNGPDGEIEAESTNGADATNRAYPGHGAHPARELNPVHELNPEHGADPRFGWRADPRADPVRNPGGQWLTALRHDIGVGDAGGADGDADDRADSGADGYGSGGRYDDGRYSGGRYGDGPYGGDRFPGHRDDDLDATTPVPSLASLPSAPRPPDGGFGGEDELRRLLRSSVDDLEPAPDALDQLRRAVPARRRRRRHAVVGAAAALLLGGTSIPAMVHVATLDDGSADRPANAASSQRADGTVAGPYGDGPEDHGAPPTGKDGRHRGSGEPDGDGTATRKGGPGQDVGSGTPDPYETMDVTSPVCGREQLGKATGKVGPADSGGRVYGAFRVVNTSDAACSVDGGGTVDAVAQGSTKADHIHVVDHTSGDEATGLPDPATAPDQLVLKPGQAYEVKFAWIPDAGGGTTGCAHPGPSPTPEPSKSPAAAADSSPATAGEGGGGGGDGQDGSGNGSGDGGGSGDGAAPGGIMLSHTPEAGEPAATDATIKDACSGTVYRTGVLPTE